MKAHNWLTEMSNDEENNDKNPAMDKGNQGVFILWK